MFISLKKKKKARKEKKKKKKGHTIVCTCVLIYDFKILFLCLYYFSQPIWCACVSEQASTAFLPLKAWRNGGGRRESSRGTAGESIRRTERLTRCSQRSPCFRPYKLGAPLGTTLLSLHLPSFPFAFSKNLANPKQRDWKFSTYSFCFI